MAIRMREALPTGLLLSVALATTGCECIDCNREGPIVGHLRALVRDGIGAPVAGASIHIDHRGYITEPKITGADGSGVLLVYMDTEPSDTGTVTVVPPTGYQTPSSQAVTFLSGDTVSADFTLHSQ